MNPQQAVSSVSWLQPVGLVLNTSPNNRGRCIFSLVFLLPYVMFLEMPLHLVICPYHFRFRFLTIMSRSSWFPIACSILLWDRDLRYVQCMRCREFYDTISSTWRSFICIAMVLTDVNMHETRGSKEQQGRVTLL